MPEVSRRRTPGSCASNPGWVTGRPEQERGGRLAPGGWKRLELTAPLRFKNKHTPACSGRVGEDLGNLGVSG